MSTPAPIIAITSGEPAGIGPDLCVLLAQQRFPAQLTFIGDRDLFAARARMLGLAFPPAEESAARACVILHVPAVAPVTAGELNLANARYVLNLLDAGINGCQSGRYAALVTAPVQKSVINDAGIAFSGHTEYLARKTSTGKVVMMLTGGGLRVALASTHLALKDVAAAITRESLTQVITILHADLQRRFRIAKPRILVAGLNPHAGEAGHLGREEIEVIAPVLAQLRAHGMHLTGPLPADTLFTPQHLKDADCVLAMYHDQGLPVLKYASFGAGVNVTLGLPIIRTSVDHGTALDRAGTGDIDTGSMVAAVNLAIELAQGTGR